MVIFILYIAIFSADIILSQIMWIDNYKEAQRLPKHRFVYLSGPSCQLRAQLTMCIWGGTICLRTMENPFEIKFHLVLLVVFDHQENTI